MSKPTLILGSGSPYRRQILSRLGLTCEQIAPDVDESAISAADPASLAGLLSARKAAAAADKVGIDSPWVLIGSDQVCHREGIRYDKPGTMENAHRQLAVFSDSWVTFSTALTLLTHDGRQNTRVEDFECHFRALSDVEIEQYLALDKPLDCAGSIKAESAGLTLMNDTRGRDFNTLLGLPVMLLREMLVDADYNIFDFR